FCDVAPAAWRTAAILPVIAIVIIAVVRGSARELTAVIAVAAVVAIWSTVNGLGPFVRPDLNESLMLLQMVVGVGAAAALLLCAAVRAQSRAADSDARRKPAETALESLSPAAIAVAIAGMVLSVMLWRMLSRDHDASVRAQVRIEAANIASR